MILCCVCRRLVTWLTIWHEDVCINCCDGNVSKAIALKRGTVTVLDYYLEPKAPARWYNSSKTRSCDFHSVVLRTGCKCGGV